MWFYVSLLALAILFMVWLSRTNLYRHWRAHNSDPGQQGTGRSALGGDLGDHGFEGRRFEGPRRGSSD